MPPTASDGDAWTPLQTTLQVVPVSRDPEQYAIALMVTAWAHATGTGSGYGYELDTAAKSRIWAYLADRFDAEIHPPPPDVPPRGETTLQRVNR